jgi:hypothetical protein
MRRHVVVLCSLVAGLVAFTASPAHAQNRCADCHIANPDAPGHISEWDTSAHGRNNVGCETCHGGNATTFEAPLAHRDILSSVNPASPVAYANLPRTCGSCHTGPYVAFQKSKHFEMLAQGNTNGPSCATCHGAVAARLLSPKSLESQCASCHGAGKANARPEFPAQARQMQEGIRDVRADLDEAQKAIRRIKDPARRTSLEADYQQAEVPLIEATNSGHAFVFDNLQERLGVARTRTAALLERLANQAR